MSRHPSGDAPMSRAEATRRRLDREAAWMRYRYGRGPMPPPLDSPTPGHGRHMARQVWHGRVAAISEWEMWA